MPAASIPSATPVNMYRSASSDGSSTSSTMAAVHPTTVARLRLPTPPRSPGLAPLGKQLTLIEPPITKGIRFLILDCPTDSTLPFYLAELRRNNVTDVVRCCEPTYSTETLLAESIVVHDWAFRDGAVVCTTIQVSPFSTQPICLLSCCCCVSLHAFSCFYGCQRDQSVSPLLYTIAVPGSMMITIGLFLHH